IAVANVAIVGEGLRGPAGVIDEVDARGVGDRQRFQHQGVEHAEHHRVRADPSASDRTATSVNAGLLRSTRKAYRVSCANASSPPHPHISLLLSVSSVGFPRRRIAA